MTVSPKWPQDGNRQPKAVGSGVRSDEDARSPATPPTLFKLPNLNPAPPAAATPTQAIQKPDGPAQVTTPSPDSASLASQPSSPSAPRKTPDPELPAHSEPHADTDDQPRPPTPPAVAHTIATPATTIESSRQADPEPVSVASPQGNSPLPRKTVSSDAPTARSWMETLGSHGVIAVLLLIVVVAALITGRDSGDLDSEASLAEYSELLDFDDGTQVDLPIPPHDFSAAVDLSATSQAATPNNELDPSVQGADISATRTVLAAPVGSAADAAQADQVPSTAISMDSNKSEAAAGNDSIVSLDVPQASSAATQQTAQPNLDAWPLNRVQVNEFMSGPANVDVLAVANRVATESSDSELPSLEDLTGAHTSDTQPSTANQAGPAPVLSKTPAGVRDWSQYLPGFQPAVAADNEIPSTSN